MTLPRTKPELKSRIETEAKLRFPAQRVLVTTLGRGRALYISPSGKVWRLLYKATSWTALLKKVVGRHQTPEEKAVEAEIRLHKKTQRVSKKET